MNTFKEIGSYISSIPLSDNKNNYFNDQLLWFISGRAALDHILKDIIVKNNKVKTVAIPDWCCDSMIEPILLNNLEPVFYQIEFVDGNLKKDLSVNADIFLNLDYFGYEINDHFDFDGIVIDDVTQSIFSKKESDADYYFGSLRKWVGVKTGAFAYSKNGFAIGEPINSNDKYLKIRSDAMDGKNNYLDGLSNDKSYLNLFSEAEDMLIDLYGCKADLDDIRLIEYLDIDYLKTRRKDNVSIIMKYLGEYAMFKDYHDRCILYVPIIVPDGKRELLRKQLIDRNIYCPCHWSISDMHKIDNTFIYDNELSIICDQRYDTDEIEYMCKCIVEILNG